VACEISTSGVVAARSPEPGLPLATVGKVDLPENALVPGLKPGNIADRVAVVAAFRRVLEQVAGRSGNRNGDLTLIIPDAAVRVLLLDFDTLPAKLSEALPIVRFRLKKLVPFEADDAMVSFQIMSTSRTMVRVLAVAMPRDVLAEYESVAREAGFEPGAVLPSTLAALAALNEGEGASLVVNAHPLGVTTAIVRAGIVLLHRSIELAEYSRPLPAGMPSALFETTGTGAAANTDLLPLVDRDDTHAEWAAQQPLPEYGRNPYADRLAAEVPTQAQDSITGLPEPAVAGAGYGQAGHSTHGSHTFDMYANEAAPVSRSPYASPTLQDELSAEFHSSVSINPALPDLSRGPGADDFSLRDYAGREGDPEPRVHELAPDALADEIARAVSVAVAYFEDSLSVAPEVLLSAGPLGAENLNRILQEQGIAVEEGLRVRELIDSSAVAPGAVTAAAPRSWLAGVTGALRS
jgi:type IV pilus assembly protein PilM